MRVDDATSLFPGLSSLISYAEQQPKSLKRLADAQEFLPEKRIPRVCKCPAVVHGRLRPLHSSLHPLPPWGYGPVRLLLLLRPPFIFQLYLSGPFLSGFLIILPLSCFLLPLDTYIFVYSAVLSFYFPALFVLFVSGFLIFLTLSSFLFSHLPPPVMSLCFRLFCCVISDSRHLPVADWTSILFNIFKSRFAFKTTC